MHPSIQHKQQKCVTHNYKQSTVLGPADAAISKTDNIPISLELTFHPGGGSGRRLESLNYL